MKHLSIIASALLFAGMAVAADHGDHKPANCAETSLTCADKATPFFAADGALWLAWSANGRVAVQKSTDLGRTFTSAVFVNETEKLDGGADGRPQITVDRSGRATVAYTIAKDSHYSGQVMVTWSDNPLKGFGGAQKLTADTASQRFVSFGLDGDGRVFAAWIDKRNLVAAEKAGQKYAGAALAFAWAGPGQDFAPPRIAKDNTCECCRIGIAFAGPKKPVVIWRHLYDGGVRDHAVTTFNDGLPGPVYRVAVDKWKIDACPHQGPSIAVGGNGTYHATWFTGGSAREGVFYARSLDGGRTFSAPLQIGDNSRQPSRPYVLTNGSAVWLVWKEFDGDQSVVYGMQSRDDGVTWSTPKALANTTDASDHPLLIRSGEKVFLSWLTHKEGYRLMALEGAL